MDKQTELLLIMLLEKQEEVIQLRRFISESREEAPEAVTEQG